MHQDNRDDPNHGMNTPNPGRQKGFDEDQPLDNPGTGGLDRDIADDRGQGRRPRRERDGIPEDEANVDGVGEDGRDEDERRTRDDSSGSDR